jgi:hypothetical protein
MRLTSTGLGIGTSSINYKLVVSGSAVRIVNGSDGSAANNGILLDNTAGASPNNYLPAINWNTGTLTWATIDGFRATGGGFGGTLRFNTMDTSGVNTERARIDSSGTFRVKGAGTAGSTDAVQFSGTAPASSMALSSAGSLNVVGTILRNGGYSADTMSTKFNGATETGLGAIDSSDTTDAYFAVFRRSTTNIIGSINRVGTTNAVIYNTTSDYRLKTVTGTVTGQGARIDALKPIDYQWIEGGQSSRGFLAHEFQTVYPNSVTGDKDAVDAGGNPKYQAMQASTAEVIADLVAEIQSLRQRLSAANL